MTEVSIIREDDDELADIRISLGVPKEYDGFYIVFRGDPEKVVQLLKRAHAVAEKCLPEKMYSDHRVARPP